MRTRSPAKLYEQSTRVNDQQPISNRTNVTQRLVSIQTNKLQNGRLSPLRSPSRQDQNTGRVKTEFVRRSPLKFDDEESLVSAFRE